MYSWKNHDNPKKIIITPVLFDNDTPHDIGCSTPSFNSEKLNLIIAKKLQEKGLKSILVSKDQIIGKYTTQDIKDENGNLIVGTGFDITEEQLEKIILQGKKTLEIVNIDPINKGPYLLETLKIDKNSSKGDALSDIYKVLRPGEDVPSSFGV